MPNFRRIYQRYGLTKEEYLAIRKSQDNKCKICTKSKKLVVDHCHTSGNVRGLICHNCNLMLGHAKDTTSTLQEAIKYLQRFL